MNAKARSDFPLHVSPYLPGLILLAMVLLPAQTSAGTRQATLRGCLRTLQGHTFILIAQDRLGYLLLGDRDVFSRHTDQEVEIYGAPAEPTPDRGPSSLSPQLEVTTSPGHKKDEAAVTLPGLRKVQVSSLVPLSQACSSTGVVH